MSIDKKYVDQILKVSEKAALASSYLVGKKDKIAADQAAVDAMRSELNKIDMNGEVVIGEGLLDEAPINSNIKIWSIFISKFFTSVKHWRLIKKTFTNNNFTIHIYFI